MKIINHHPEKILENLQIHEEGDFFNLTDGEKVASEKIHSSSLICDLAVEYSKNRNFLNISLEDRSIDDFGKIETIVLEDRKNLAYKKDDPTKKIYIWKPAGFDEQKKYRIIYMFDGDNLFDQRKVNKYTAEPDDYNSWQMETTLSVLHKQSRSDFLVVGISDKDGFRDAELTPSSENFEFRPEAQKFIASMRDGKLDELGDFVRQTVMPYMETRFCINRDLIGIAGASSGGLAAHYLGLRDHRLYKFIMALSAASAIFTGESWQKFYQNLDFKSQTDWPFIFMYNGGQGRLEELLLQGNADFKELLLNCGYPAKNIFVYVNREWRHNEIAWRFAVNYGLDILNKNKILG